jgi:hypothetical protein
MRFALSIAFVVAAAASSGGCASPSHSPYAPCAGRGCGDACTVCAPGDPDCAETAVVKACSAEGRCVPAPVLCGAAVPCADKTCGAECAYEPPCRDSDPPCGLPSYVGQCSAQGVCEPQGTPNTCGPMAACDGKACGDACDPCAPAGCMSPVVYACDLARRCVPSAPGLCEASAPGCTHDGTTYPIGATFPADDGCNDCHCFDAETIACTLVFCH